MVDLRFQFNCFEKVNGFFKCFIFKKIICFEKFDVLKKKKVIINSCVKKKYKSNIMFWIFFIKF